MPDASIQLASCSPDQARDQRHHKQNDSDPEQDASAVHGGACNPAEAEECCDQRNDKKYKSVMQKIAHVGLPNFKANIKD